MCFSSCTANKSLPGQSICQRHGSLEAPVGTVPPGMSQTPPTAIRLSSAMYRDGEDERGSTSSVLGEVSAHIQNAMISIGGCFSPTMMVARCSKASRTQAHQLPSPAPPDTEITSLTIAILEEKILLDHDYNLHSQPWRLLS